MIVLACLESQMHKYLEQNILRKDLISNLKPSNSKTRLSELTITLIILDVRGVGILILFLQRCQYLGLRKIDRLTSK
jgi:hypothetical protein